MSNTLCDVCRERQAVVFVTKIENNKSAQQRLCERCARERAGELSLGDDAPSLGDVSLDKIVMGLFQNGFSEISEAHNEEDEHLIFDAEDDNEIAEHLFAIGFGEFSADEDFIDELEDADDEEDEASAENPHEFPADANDIFAAMRSSRSVPAARCSKCGTTWDRLRQDGRAGCAHCYETFGEQLSEVMGRVQKGAQHAGKTPRAAAKRRARLQHLRARRDHRLEMLNRRLQEAVAKERYEDAAILRDKIKIVASTIVSAED